jgi:two-component system, OmpR family, sensor kinase
MAAVAWARRVNGRLTLRARLSALSVLLVAAGLLVAGIATHHALKAFLIDRVDQQIAGAEGTALRAAVDPGRDGRDFSFTLPPGSFAVVVSQGRVGGTFVGSNSNRPWWLASMAAAAPLGTSTKRGYRIHAWGPASDVALPSQSARLVVGVSLADTNRTLNRLAVLELVAGGAVVVVVGGLAYLLVRRELRPLVRIEETAGAIAAGDLSRRVDEAGPGTEVGRLGIALNAMLAQIELAFRARQASEDRLRRFVADASHELRTPLTSVRGYAELFRRGAADRPEDLELAMTRIEAEAQRMGVLVEDLLLLAKLDQGRPLERAPVDLTGTVREMASDHAILHPEWPMTFVAGDEVTVVGDEARLRQALGNLFSNARSHTPPGTPVEVRVGRDGESAVVQVSDHGPGVPADLAPRVFERFVRADASRARASGGAGLGLSIVAAIADAHGGLAELAGPSGDGASFRLVLPLAGPPAPAGDPASTPDDVARPASG